MKLAVVSHKVCWTDPVQNEQFLTDGGFPLQIGAISELFASTTVVVPCRSELAPDGLSPLNGRKLSVVALSEPGGSGFVRKIGMLGWLIRNGKIIFDEVRKADAVHTPIPGDVGTIGLILAIILRKPLFVRHCGNWMVQKTFAEHLWRWAMERFAGGRNVMLATGGSLGPASKKNDAVEWIFSTSLTKDQLSNGRTRELDKTRPIRLAIACRQEPRKGTDVAINALSELSADGDFMLDVIGAGSKLDELRELADQLGVSHRVVFHGKVKQSDVVGILRKAQIFCYPTTASEGFPKVVLEALASGLPVVTTNVSVLPTLIGRGCGILVDDPTPVKIADAIREVCRSVEHYRELSEKAVEVASEYSLEGWRGFIGERLRRAWNVETLDA